MMKVLLIYCESSEVSRYSSKAIRKEFPPIGLLYLAAAFEKHQYEVELCNVGASDFDVTSLRTFDVIGLSINSSYNYPYFTKHSACFRSRCKLLIGGGQHVTAYPQMCIDELHLDYAIMGEGEFVSPEVVREHFLANNDVILSMRGIALYHEHHFVNNGVAARIHRLDDLAFPARHLLPREDILQDRRLGSAGGMSIAMITSRGCNGSCAFCANLYKGVSSRSAKNVVQEIQQLMNEYPEMEGVVFLDENLMFSEEHILSLCAGIRPLNIRWTCNARVDSFSADIAPIMKEAGCIEIKYGIESGSQRILDAMKKNVFIHQAEAALRETWQNGIRTKCFLIFGFPGDNLSSAKETISFLERNRKFITRVNLFDFAPLPNSSIFTDLQPDKMELWHAYKIYHGPTHWWGTDADYKEMIQGYSMLRNYILENFEE